MTQQTREPESLDIPGRPTGAPSFGQELLATAWVIAVSAFFLGVLIGVLFRGGMFLLRLVSGPLVDGVISDDGFEIGRFTLSGTYNLFGLGTALGVLGGAAYIAVMPWLIGPRWFRIATVGVTAMLLGGAVAIHADGVDFTVLRKDVGVGVFLAIPLLAGLATPIVVDYVGRRHGSWPRWLAAVLLVTPPAVVVLAVVMALAAPLIWLRRALLAPIQARQVATWVVRAVFALIPAAALRALLVNLGDVF